MRLYLRLFFESVIFAFQALIANKLRTLLSLLGITIGIFSIISVFTMVDSLERKVRASVSSLGSDVVFVQKWPWDFGSDYPWWKYWQRPHPTLEEKNELEKRSTFASGVAFMASAKKDLSSGSNVLESASVLAISNNYDKIKNIELSKGRYFSDIELKTGKNCILIGSSVEENLFFGLNSLDLDVKVFGRKYTVIGVLKKEGQSMLGESMDDQVLIPINNAINFIDISKENTNPTLMIEARQGVTNEQLKDELTGLLRSLRKLKPDTEDNFALNETSLLLNGFDQLFRVINISGSVIGFFSILVGGFGIANIMFVSVKERTNIIGIQKSLGAKNSFVLFQFLSEAIILCLLGGAIGLTLVFLISFFLSQMMDFEIMLSLKNILTGLLISLIIGLVSGIIPAYFASRLNPVDAIRSN